MCKVQCSHVHSMGVEAESKSVKDEKGCKVKNGIVDKMQKESFYHEFVKHWPRIPFALYYLADNIVSFYALNSQALQPAISSGYYKQKMHHILLKLRPNYVYIQLMQKLVCVLYM